MIHKTSISKYPRGISTHHALKAEEINVFISYSTPESWKQLFQRTPFIISTLALKLVKNFAEQMNKVT